MEQRKLKRKQLVYYLKVSDVDSGNQLGRLVDITEEGLMLISSDPISTGVVFRMELDLPDQEKRTEKLEFEARSIWSKKDVNPNYYDTGFKFVRISGEYVDTIGKLIDEYELRS